MPAPRELNAGQAERDNATASDGFARRRAAFPDPHGVVGQQRQYAAQQRWESRKLEAEARMQARPQLRLARREGTPAAARPRPRGAGRPRTRAVARSSSRSGDSGDDGSGSSEGDGDQPPPDLTAGGKTCSCGCGRSLEGRRAGTRFYDGACRVRAFRTRRGDVTLRRHPTKPTGAA